VPDHILAIDLGTSGPKVALADMRGRILGCTHRPTRLALTAAGAAEQDPEDWWNAIVGATADLHALRLCDPADIVAVCTTAQWAGTVAIDRDGKALRDAIIWMDTRGAKYVPEVVGGLVKFEGYGIPRLLTWIRKTGGVPGLGGKEPVAHILLLRHEYPEVYRAAHKFLEPKDWLNLRLTGKIAASVDSIALHWVTDNRRIDAIDYDAQLLRMTTIPREKLPELRRATDVLGTLTPASARALGLRENVQVVMGTPDVQSAAIGSGAVREAEGHVYIGTSSWLSCHVGFKKTDLLRNMASLPSALPGRYFVANSQETAGACLTWLRDNVLFADDALATGNGAPDDFFARIETAAESAPPGCEGLLFMPWLFGERTPIADSHVRAAFVNQSLTTTRAHMVRAVLEGVGYNLRWLLDAVEHFVGRRMDPLRFVGGGARSRLWCQVLADVLDREIHQVADPVQCNARGAACLAAIGLGKLRVDDVPSCVAIAEKFAPRGENRRTYDALYREFLAFYRATKRIHARLAAARRRPEDA
jgi:xylulokinase